MKLTIEEALNLDLGDRVVVRGLPASGKTYFTEKLAERNPTHVVFHSDDFIKYGFKESLYKMIEGVAIASKFIVEGVQSERFLRKILEEDYGIAPVTDVIEIVRPWGEIEAVYRFSRGADKLKGVESMAKSQAKVWDEYLHAVLSDPPSIPQTIHTVDNPTHR